MQEDVAEVIVVAGQTQAERIAQELSTAGMTAFVRKAAGTEGMFGVVVERSHLAEARDIAAAFQNCECQQEGNRDEAELGTPHKRRKPRTGIVE
jgi:hypothetical protein